MNFKEYLKEARSQNWYGVDKDGTVIISHKDGGGLSNDLVTKTIDVYQRETGKRLSIKFSDKKYSEGDTFKESKIDEASKIKVQPYADGWLVMKSQKILTKLMKEYDTDSPIEDEGDVESLEDVVAMISEIVDRNS